MAKTLRVHSLAKELSVTSKQVIEKCRAEGIELKNHMAAVQLGLAESIREWFSVGEDVTSIEVAERVDLSKVCKPSTRTLRKEAAELTEPQTAQATLEAPPLIETEEIPATEAPIAVAVEAPPEVAEPVAEAEAEVTVESEEEPGTVVAQPPEAPETPQAPTEAEVALAEGEAVPEPPAPPEPPPEPIMPAGPKLVPKPAELRGPRVVRIEAPEPVRPLRSRPAARAPITPPEQSPATAAPGRKGQRGRGGKDEDREGAGLRSRSPRRHGQTADAGERLREWRNQDLLERRERLASVTGHGLRERRAAEKRRRATQVASAGPALRKTPVEIVTPISLKDFCAAVGLPFVVISKKLMEHTGKLWTINQSLDAETAELIALDLGVSVTIAKARTALEKLIGEFEQHERPNRVPRPPVVAMLGHVDHGKTSLLDTIRQSDVAKGEAGGITQHIGAYRIDREGWRVTFLDTPGHEAFTAMRSRGADLTDVVVLVVAADDGVMPQTIEAINHAKAAGVQIVVALNKIDLPGVDLDRIYGQLAEQELVPSEWGGDTDVIKTSAVTGEGIDDLIAHLSTLSELLVLKADPRVPAQGMVIESQMREGQGVVAQVLDSEGTLKPGQVIVCGGGFGRVRVLRDDRGRNLKAALPGWPVQIAGLDVLPKAGDRLYQVTDLKLAKEIAGEIGQRRREESLETTRKPRTLEDLLAAGGDEARVPELAVIVRADVQGSVDVLKQSLSNFPSDKATLRILQAAVGAISEADVHFAQTSGAIIIGFHVVPEDHARRLAEQLGVEIRLYRVIYEIIDDMYKALAGLLEPLQRLEVRGTAEVRQVFNISRLGTVAGCMVTNGTVSRNHKVRLVRDSRMVLEAGALHSLKRFKDDAREVRAGLECGIKVVNFDDLKPGDVIEAYEVVEELQEL